MSDDHCYLKNFFNGLHVKIKTSNEIIVEGEVQKIITQIDYDSWGIFVELKTGERGNTVEIVQTAEEKEDNILISNFIYDLQRDESEKLEFKETWAFPVNPEKEISEITKIDKKQIRFFVAKTIAAFANSYGGTLYIGIQDRTKRIMGLDRDLKLLDEGKQDRDGLRIQMMSSLESFFGRGNMIWEIIKIKFINREEKEICVIKVEKSKFALIATFGNNNYYFVRQNDSSKNYETMNNFLDYWTRHISENLL